MATGARTTSQPSADLEKLVERVEEEAADPMYAYRKDLWTRHLRGEKTAKTPVYLYLVGGVSVAWQELIPPETLVSRDSLERAIELQLRQKLYRHDHVPDDDVLVPTVWIKPVRPEIPPEDVDSPTMKEMASRPAPSDYGDTYGESMEAARLWGLPFQRVWTGDSGGAYKVEPAVASKEDLSQLHRPAYEVDEEATQALWERASELVGGRLPVKIATDELGASPTETMVDLLGIEPVLYGVVERPDFIHRLMELITEGYIAYHRAREAAGAVDAEESWARRVHYEELPKGADAHLLTSTWASIAAQSLCGLSPAMYEEFIQPYHDRLAAILGERRIYYHGCEDLTAKIPIIRKLPNLRRFCVSPWTNLEVAVEQLGREFVLETHVHPTDTLYAHTPDEMRKALERIMEVAGDCVVDICCEVHSVGPDPSVVTTWSQIAQEVTERHA
jgi:hypothetical protein